MSTTNGQAPAGLEIYDGDQVHKIRFEDFTGLDFRAFRLEMGMSLMDAMTIVLSGRNEPDILAALTWLHLRKSNDRLRFEDVAERFTLDHVIDGVEKRHKAARPWVSDSEVEVVDPEASGVDS